MIKNFIQPPKIIINENLELVKYYPNYNLTINWYSSPKLCKQVDGKEEAYSKERLKNMYKFLCKNGLIASLSLRYCIFSGKNKKITYAFLDFPFRKGTGGLIV